MFAGGGVAWEGINVECKSLALQHVYAMQTFFFRKQEDKAGRRKEKAKQASRVA